MTRYSRMMSLESSCKRQVRLKWQLDLRQTLTALRRSSHNWLLYKGSSRFKLSSRITLQGSTHALDLTNSYKTKPLRPNARSEGQPQWLRTLTSLKLPMQRLLQALPKLLAKTGALLTDIRTVHQSLSQSTRNSKQSQVLDKPVTDKSSQKLPIKPAWLLQVVTTQSLEIFQTQQNDTLPWLVAQIVWLQYKVKMWRTGIAWSRSQWLSKLLLTQVKTLTLLRYLRISQTRQVVSLVDGRSMRATDTST